MTDDAGSAGPVHQQPSGGGASVTGPHARFVFLPASEREPATVRAIGDIDLTNVGQFQAALDEAAAAASSVTADMTAVTYCDSGAIRALFTAASRARLTIKVSTGGSVTETLLKVSGLDQIASVITAD